MSKLLFDESPLCIIPSLAVKLGLADAIIIQQLHYLLQKTEYIFDGEPWIYKTAEEWAEIFPFWCEKTIRRTFTSLINKGYVKTGTFNHKKYDKTLWYTINYAVFGELENSCDQSQRTKCPDGSGQNVQMDLDKMSRPIPIDLYKNLKDKNKDLYTPEFEKWYKDYPNPENKGQTFRNWKSLLKEFTVEQLETAKNNYKSRVKAEQRERQYIKNSSNFLGRDATFKEYLSTNPIQPQVLSKEDIVLANYKKQGETF